MCILRLDYGCQNIYNKRKKNVGKGSGKRKMSKLENCTCSM